MPGRCALEAQSIAIAVAAAALLWPLGAAARGHPALLWGAAWLCLLGSGIALLLFPPSAAPLVIGMLGPLFPAGQLAGAYALERRRAPAWIIPTALALGVLRVGAHGSAWIEPFVGVVVEPLGTLMAAWIVSRVLRRGDASWSAYVIPPALVAAALVDCASAWIISPQGVPTFVLGGWVVVAALAGPPQIYHAADRYLRHQAKLRRHTEDELQETRERFRALTENAFDLIAELDGDENLTYVNPRYEEVLGYPVSAFLGWKPADFVHPDDLVAAARFAAQADAEGRASGLVVRARHQDGSWRWLENVAGSFVTRSGERRWVMNSRDVTERRAHEESLERGRERLEMTVSERTAALRESEARFRALADHAPELISEFDDEGRYTFANASFKDLLGLEPEALLGTTPDELIHPDDQAGSRAGLTYALRKQTAAYRLHRLRHTDGSWRWFDNTGRAYRTPTGELRFVSIGRDVTEAVEAEEERRQLQQHMQEVQRLESLGVLAGGIAHDFNNLLAVILGNTALLESHAESDPESNDRLRRIRAAARHAEALTDQMLAYAGRSVSDLTPLDLSQLVRDTKDLLHAAVPKKCKLELELGRELPAVKGDVTQLRQVLVNLVANAGEALREESGHVRVRTALFDADRAALSKAFGAAERPEGSWMMLEVSDDGPGMDAELSGHVFEPFFTTRESGRGLGLAAVLGIASAHGGVMKLETELGHGTVFQLLLRPTTETAKQADPKLHPHPAQPEAGVVLVVDDDEAVREVAQALLERGGLRVECCSGGHDALARIRGGSSVDAVLLDLAMPELSGAEVLRMIRVERPDLPVVIASGYKRDLAAEQLEDDEVFGFVHKPYDPDTLIGIIREALRATRAA